MRNTREISLDITISLNYNYTYKNRIHHSVGEVTTGIRIIPKIAAARSWRHDKMVSRLCREGAA